MKKFARIMVLLLIVTAGFIFLPKNLFAGDDAKVVLTFHEQKQGQDLERLDAVGNFGPQTFGEFVTIYHIDVPISPNYSFRGWMYLDGAEEKILKVGDRFDRDTDFYALWGLTRRIVSYDLDGGINDPANPNYFYGTEDITLLPARKDGLFFVAWYDTPTFDGERITYLGDGVKSLTLYARFADSIYTVSFDLDYPGAPLIDDLIVAGGDKVSFPIIPTREIGRASCRERV